MIYEENQNMVKPEVSYFLGCPVFLIFIKVRLHKIELKYR